MPRAGDGVGKWTFSHNVVSLLLIQACGRAV